MTRLPNFQPHSCLDHSASNCARAELLDDAGLPLVYPASARQALQLAPRRDNHEWGGVIHGAGLRIDRQPHEHDLFRHGRSTKSGITAPQARVTPAWFFCGESAVRSLNQSVSR
jgi:hypothetical protein